MEEGLISVDRWKEQSQAYFLTHLHSDHTNGLSRRWKKGPIFCSPITAKLFPLFFPGFNLSLLRVLEIGSRHSLSLSSPSNGSEIVVWVTAIDAQHCPGAVMYLFRGEFGSMLYTGDFRWEMHGNEANTGKGQLLAALEGDKLDFLYMDNTYCNPCFSFPPRKIVAQQVVDFIVSHPECNIIIGIDNLGKEELLLHISHALGTKLWVWPERLQIMELLGFSDAFTTNTSVTRVRAVPRYSLTIENLEGLNTVHPTIGIMPSGLPWVRPRDGKDAYVESVFSVPCKRERKRNSRMRVNVNQFVGKSKSPRMFHQYLYSVMYSDHSCFSELQEFIEFVKPSNIRGIVTSTISYTSPLYFFGDLREDDDQADQSHKNIGSMSRSAEIKQSESAIGSNKPNAATATSAKKVTCLGACKKRVRISRRQSRGARIAETDSTS